MTVMPLMVQIHSPDFGSYMLLDCHAAGRKLVTFGETQPGMCLPPIILSHLLAIAFILCICLLNSIHLVFTLLASNPVPRTC